MKYKVNQLSHFNICFVTCALWSYPSVWTLGWRQKEFNFNAYACMY